ncbi:MAG: UvrD-helicase domain-containing protein [Candidatus Marinimicrobia bacterium]|nr:UvrD-helicase domain-containing protein [Candidatus Neomarinimicrobiota bacterium]
MLGNLSKVQKDAVVYNQGPSLIFAGAGSGKTRVLTHKIAYLIDKNIVRPENILALTFTNKAADEMKERVKALVGPVGSRINIGTFHSICSRILRKEIHHLGYTRNFTIYDTTDQKNLVKDIVNRNNFDTEGITNKGIVNKIATLKNEGTKPEEFEPEEFSNYDKVVNLIYPLYQKNLKKSNAVDFGDLLVLPLEIFKKKPKVLDKYQTLFQFILVDEYQDTNHIQFQLIKNLGEEHQNVCVVGDDDQSIYSWRGADISNILSFESTFPGAKVFKLEQNYRSTKTIVQAASSVVEHNEDRADKELWSDKKEGEKVTLINTRDEYDEARQIAQKIQSEIYRNKRKFKDFAILYRTNAQSRVLEQLLNRHKIPNTIVGGVRFYERAEIKDILAYLKLFANPKDDISLKRIINRPRRGIGKKTLAPLEQFAQKKDIPIFEALSHLDFIDLRARGKKVLKKFHKLIKRYKKLKAKLPLEEWVRILIDDIELREHLKKNKSEKAQQKIANLDELINAISDYCSQCEEPSLEGFLEEVSLVADIDNWDDSRNCVSMMTLHSAKGLEFPVVIIAGVNESLLPVGWDQSADQLSEERRLFYVGLTRAREKAFLTTAQNRNIRGETRSMSPSRFLEEIPDKLIETQGSISGFSPSPNAGRAAQSNSKNQTQSKSPQRKPNRSSRKTTKNRKKEFVQPETGMTVRHKMFGRGKILHVAGYGKNSKLKIKFKGHNIKTIIARYVQIEE